MLGLAMSCLASRGGKVSMRAHLEQLAMKVSLTYITKYLGAVGNAETNVSVINEVLGLEKRAYILRGKRVRSKRRVVSCPQDLINWNLKGKAHIAVLTSILSDVQRMYSLVITMVLLFTRVDRQVSLVDPGEETCG
jgi:hypothetical protein